MTQLDQRHAPSIVFALAGLIAGLLAGSNAARVSNDQLSTTTIMKGVDQWENTIAQALKAEKHSPFILGEVHQTLDFPLQVLEQAGILAVNDMPQLIVENPYYTTQLDETKTPQPKWINWHVRKPNEQPILKMSLMEPIGWSMRFDRLPTKVGISASFSIGREARPSR